MTRLLFVRAGDQSTERRLAVGTALAGVTPVVEGLAGRALLTLGISVDADFFDGWASHEGAACGFTVGAALADVADVDEVLVGLALTGQAVGVVVRDLFNVNR